MWPICDGLKKHQAFREVWVAYLMGGAFFLLGLYQTSGYRLERWWYFIQQDIHSYGNTLVAFLIVLGLSRLVCCEHEYGTGRIIRTSKQGHFLVWRAKIFFTIGYCAIIVLVIGLVSLLVHGGQIGFRDALAPASETVLFYGAVPLTNLGYCIAQYVFLFLAAIYFSGFVLIIAQATQRTALTLFLCGGSYIALLGYHFVGHLWVQGTPLYPITELLFRFSFMGFMSLESFNWGFSCEWGQIWKPITVVILLSGLEFVLSWLLWQRRANK